jgi:tetratricopeptide (TPR) repeat protein
MVPQDDASGSGLADFPATAILGANLPVEAERHLRASALSYHRDEVAEQHLREARRIAPSHPAVLIALYRFYFYKGRLAEALSIAEACLLRAAIENSLPLDWRNSTADGAEFSNFEALWPRFFMFVLKGYAYLNLRLGDLEEGREAALKLLELDPADKVGAAVLLAVLDRMGVEDVD